MQPWEARKWTAMGDLGLVRADYIEFLRAVTPNNAEDNMNQLRRFNMGQIGDVDCPVFDGLYDYCAVRGFASSAVIQSCNPNISPYFAVHLPTRAQLYAGGSVTGAAMLANKEAELAFNWSGKCAFQHLLCRGGGMLSAWAPC